MFNILERMQPKPVDTTPLAVSAQRHGSFLAPVCGSGPACAVSLSVSFEC